MIFPLKGASQFITLQSLMKYHLPDALHSKCGYDGRMEWNPNESMDITIHQFRTAVLSGNVNVIKDILENLQNLNPGQIQRFLSLLTDRSSAEPIKEALMTAICIGSRPLVEFILSLFLEYPGAERNGCRKSKSFPTHMTPLMLACICKNFAIVQCLLLRNHFIQLPHRPDCSCEDCSRSSRSMTNSIILLDTYRAISSEPFLWLACTDPLLAAFSLIEDLRVCEAVENKFKARVLYSDLCNNVMLFTVKIIEQCWDGEEINVLLSRKVGSTLADCELPFPRIQMAIKSHIKPFLSSLGVQTTMEDHWKGMWTDYGKSRLQDFSREIRHFVLYPIFAFIHAISAGRYIKTFKYPLARYISRLASYVLFLSALTAIRYFGRTNEQSADRGLFDNNFRLLLESYVYLYVYGFAVIHYIEFASKGLANFYDVWWRWFDLMLIWLFSGAFFCFVMTAATVYQDGLSHLHRRHWVYYDFSLMYDIYFGAASVMAFWRILYYFQLHRYIGSTVISISKCIRDVLIFLSICAIIMICFSLGINTMYQPYNQNSVVDKDGNVIHQKNTYSTIGITFRNLYWSFYGYLAPWDYTLVVGNAGPDQAPVQHPITNIAGEIMIASFHIAVVVTLLNLMISMLVRTADNVLKNKDHEWKFTRCRIYAEYFEWFSAIPPPFNLLYNTTCALYRAFSDDFKFVYPDLWIPKKFWKSSMSVIVEQDILYLKLMRTLFERYRHSQEYHYQTVMKEDVERLSEEDKKVVYKIFLALITLS
ncbi:unnamed protein product [Thelazia callipaeda]|uniref:TRP_2 domain-containing protein n=1 Tax=Thelazia callipaeda TaxID=103827 RepID=A0A158RBB4_THECL|nr:unnamed protein product [Thelazia callipaeda]